MQFVIGSAQSLERLRTDPALRRAITRVALRRPTDGSMHPLEPALNRHYFACGCVHGALAVHAGLMVGGALWFLGVGFDDWQWWKLAFVAVSCALAGKLLGIAASKWQLRSIYLTLQREFKDASDSRG